MDVGSIGKLFRKRSKAFDRKGREDLVKDAKENTTWNFVSRLLYRMLHDWYPFASFAAKSFLLAPPSFKRLSGLQSGGRQSRPTAPSPATL